MEQVSSQSKEVKKSLIFFQPIICSENILMK